MVERLIKNIESNQLFSPNDTLLVGVSGGIDSVVLIDLLFNAGYAFDVAHCNFNLRGDESNRDENFVQGLAAKYDKQFFCKSFNTKDYAFEEGISIEMAARELRYQWFEKIRHENRYDWIVVAHHQDDQAETFFLNLARGTGILGLTGMKAVNGKIIRPLLFATRKEIEAYSSAKALHYCEDSTNALTDYQRNKIRHLVLPLMEELNPSFREGLLTTIAHLRDASLIYTKAIEAIKERVISHNSPELIEISISELKLLDPLPTYLYELMKEYHFNGEVVEDLIKSIDKQSGKQFFSSTHRAILDRELIIIQKFDEQSSKRYYLDEKVTNIDFPVKLSITKHRRSADLRISNSDRTAMIDYSKLQFPLILRRWQKGDYFKPLGMNGMKKLSDFFIDEKLSLNEKEKTWILANGEEIVWIVGFRLDDRYKITSATINYLEISLD